MNESNKYILVAEDDKFYANVYRVKLAKEGYQVMVVGNGEELLTEARKKTPDLILLDLIMPGKDGFETLQELKADPKLKSVKVVIMSNLGQTEDVAKAKGLGADDYMVKTNISVQELMSKISSYF